MTNKTMICPFCGAELEKFGGGDFPMMHYCDNTNCKLYHIMGQYTLWQALIDGKKAQDALDYAVAFFRGRLWLRKKMGCPDIQNGYKKILKEISKIQFGGTK